MKINLSVIFKYIILNILNKLIINVIFIYKQFFYIEFKKIIQIP